ncbi:LysE/ArgO family amino acid transporter [Rhizobium paknamense]|uniref:L-lysine exporter family protein LysE/ArgO n=1 Tax=Rhizobium paknamense TaxID=1206817 RepID=A0ABU0IB97_9HYPH|nr:LysE/ArgO family amino acid transporter [Rhizobium paknamense]MDQ0454566.1 L-lysine exporter family protein LysE/ArgO [Rhizobium paknamense]
MQTAFLSGFSLSLSLILAIGAQNAFVLRQGLQRQHVFAVAVFCGLSDALLISLGVGMLDTLTRALPLLEPLLRYGGAVFLVYYGLKHALAAFGKAEALTVTDGEAQSLKAVLITCLALTFLNPHVYLDTVLLIGSIASQFEGRKPAFAAGAMTASFLFFFTLAYGARLLTPLFARPISWRILDAAIALLMVFIAASLIIE